MILLGRKAALVAFASLMGAAANAIVFTNVTIKSPPLSDGSSYATAVNAITFFVPNALVGDGLPLRFGTLNIQYDADSSGELMVADEVVISMGTGILGRGTILFRETVHELDATGAEIGEPIGSSFHTFDANSNPFFSDTIVFSKAVTRFRAKKSFTLSAPDSADPNVTDLAAVAYVNQNIHLVPEPATLGALALGALGVLRRRNKR